MAQEINEKYKEISDRFKDREMFPKAMERAREFFDQLKKQPEILNNMKEQPKTITYFHASYGTIFWDQDDKIITSIHENDGNYRSEYFDSLFTHFGIKVSSSKSKPKWLTKDILEEYGIA